MTYKKEDFCLADCCKQSNNLESFLNKYKPYGIEYRKACIEVSAMIRKIHKELIEKLESMQYCPFCGKFNFLTSFDL